MYINTKLLQEKQIHLSTVLSLQLLKQNRQEDLSSVMESYFGSEGLKLLEEAGYVEYVKQKKKSDTLFHLARLSKKGTELLEDLQVPEISQNDLIFFNWLAERYITADKKLGNQKKTKLYIALFRVHTGISENKLAVLCNEFISDEQNFEYNNVLEYMWFKPTNMYEKFDINQSRLYQYYQNKKEYFDKLFEKYE